MKKTAFARYVSHAPIILPSVGSEKDREQVCGTISALKDLGQNLKRVRPDSIIISSLHRSWRFNVPLFFLAKEFKSGIKTCLIGLEKPEFYFKRGREVYKSLSRHKKYALIVSGTFLTV